MNVHVLWQRNHARRALAHVQNLFRASIYNVLAILSAVGARYPSFGVELRP